MTDCQTDTAPLVEDYQRIERSLMWLLAARLFLALFVIALIFFLFRWSSAVRRDTIIAPAGQTVPDEWKVVIPEYAGGGRGSTLIALKPWKLGTMADHPIAVALCVAAAVLPQALSLPAPGTPRA